MRIFLSLTLGVVLAVDGDEFLRHHTRSEPQPQPEKVLRDWTELQRTVRLSAVQEDGDRRYRDMRDNQRV